MAADSGDDLVSYQALLRTTFDVTASTPYHLRSSIDFDPFHPNGSLATMPVTLYRVSLRRVPAGDGGDALVDERRLQGEFLFGAAGPHASVDRTGTLSAGRYELLLNVQSEFAQDEEDGRYQLSFTTSNGRPSVVPLPPAVWTGLLTLAGLAGVIAYSDRRSRGDTWASPP